MHGEEGKRGCRLAMAQLTSATGDGIVLAVLPFAVLAVGGTPAQLSIALAVQALAMAALFLPAGVVGDRLRRRGVVVASDLLRFGARGGIALLLILGDASFWQILVAQAIHGAGSALFYTTMDGFVPEVIDDERLLRKTNALRFLGVSLGMTAGPALGGAVYAAAGAGWAFGLDAATFLVSAALVFRLPTPFAAGERASGKKLRSLLGDVAEGWRAFRGIGWYWRVASEFAVLNTLVFAPFFVIGPHVAGESLGGAGAWAAILVTLGLGELIGGMAIMAWQPARPLQLATKSIAVWVLPLLALALLAPIGLLVAGAALAGMSVAVFNAIWETAKQTHTPPHLRARLGSFDRLGSLGLVPFGYMLGGATIAVVGASPALIAAAAILVVATFMVATDPSVRGMEAREGRDLRVIAAPHTG